MLAYYYYQMPDTRILQIEEKRDVRLYWLYTRSIAINRV